jgi:hypothetical protein
MCRGRLDLFVIVTRLIVYQLVYTLSMLFDRNLPTTPHTPTVATQHWFEQLDQMDFMILLHGQRIWAWLESDPILVRPLVLRCLNQLSPTRMTTFIATSRSTPAKAHQLAALASHAISAVFRRRFYSARVCDVLLPFVDLHTLVESIAWFDILHLPTQFIHPTKTAWHARTHWKALTRDQPKFVDHFEHACRTEYARRLRTDTNLDVWMGKLLGLPALETSVITRWIIQYVT